MNSHLSDLTLNEWLIFFIYDSYKTNIEKINNTNIKILRAITFEEESYEINNQSLEYLTSGGKIEELYISEERHKLDSLPIPHLSNLRFLFICNDRNVKIDDNDLYYLPNLELIQLSHNNKITNTGLQYCKKLKFVILHSNKYIYPYSGPTIFVSDNIPIDDIEKSLLDEYYKLYNYRF